MDYVKTGYFSECHLDFPSVERMKRGPVAVIECSQMIPCNPCNEACPTSAIRIGSNINECPGIDFEACTGCGLCVGACPGLAVFMVDLSKGHGLLTIPYELEPPAQGERVELLDRTGTVVGEGIVEKVRIIKKHDRTSMIILKIGENQVNVVRGFRRK